MAQATAPDKAETDLFQQQVKDGDLGKAQATLDGMADRIPDPMRRYMQCEIAFKRNRPQEVVELMTPLLPLEGQKLRATNTVARAYSAMGQHETALERLSEIPGNDASARLRIDAAIGMRDFERAAELAAEARAAYPGAGFLTMRIIVAYLRGGYEADAFDIVEKALGTPDGFRFARAYWVNGLIAGTCDFQRRRWVFGDTSGGLTIDQVFNTALLQLYGDGMVVDEGLAADRETFKAMVRQIAPYALFPMQVQRLARQFSLLGEHDEAFFYIDVYDRQGGMAADVAFNESVWNKNIEASKLEALAEFVGVPEAERDDWKRRVTHSENMPTFMRALLHASKEDLRGWAAQIDKPDFTPLAEVTRSGRPGIVASCHCGILMATLAYMPEVIDDLGVPLYFFGQSEVERQGFCFGEHIVPRTLTTSSRVSMARTLMKFMRDDKFVFITADFSPGAQYTYKMNGCLLRLPDSVPRMAQKMNVDTFFCATFFENDRLTTNLFRLPDPEPDEDPDAFVDRWFATYLAEVHRIACLDPRNVNPFGSIRKLKPGEA